MTNCTFSGNSGDRGGGMCNTCCSPTLTNCTFSGNSAERGGGMCNRAYGGHSASPKLTNCIFWSNCDSSGTGESAQIYRGTPVVTFSCIQDDDPNDTYIPFVGADNNNIDDDPCFVEPGQWADANDPNIPVEPSDPNAMWFEGDYHLLPSSPCIEAGDPNFVVGPNDVDIDGQPRVIGSRVDIGADEFAYIGDLNFSSFVDMLDFVILAAQWHQTPGIPSADIAPTGGNGKVNFQDLDLMFSNWLRGKK